MQRFFSENIHNNNIELDSAESRHLAKVLRLKEGAKIEVIDGKGHLYKCSILDAHHKKSQLRVDEKINKEEKYFVSIAAAPTKNLNRWEFFMEKATEIGIDKIIPILTSNSERKVLKLERQKKILLSAVKQSFKLNIPLLEEMQSFKKFIAKDFDGDKFIAHCEIEEEKKSLQIACKPNTNTLVLIGPEGDFSPEEIQMAKHNGFVSVSLGNSRLRTETAALLACHIVNLKNE